MDKPREAQPSRESASAPRGEVAAIRDRLERIRAHVAQQREFVRSVFLPYDDVKFLLDLVAQQGAGEAPGAEPSCVNAVHGDANPPRTSCPMCGRGFSARAAAPERSDATGGTDG